MRALVTGAGRGIGSAIAAALNRRGVTVVSHRRSSGVDRNFLVADFHDPAQVERLWTAALVDGPVDLLVNNAAIYDDHPPLSTSPEMWERAWRDTLEVNLQAPARLSFLAARHMAARGGGRIINISSRGAFRGEPRAPAYGASKAGLNALSQSLALALAPHKVHVYCLAPGWVDTDMAAGTLHGPRAAEIAAQHPLGRVATAEEVASAAVYCALDAPPAMTGCVIDINGASYLRT